MKVMVTNPDAYFGMQGTRDKLLPAVFFEDLPEEDPIKRFCLGSPVDHNLVFIKGSDLHNEGVPNIYFCEDSFYAFQVGTDVTVIEM
ncbi:hypothetical protein [Escherichia coli]|uniref:hypothetical protein n=1 Tax=Escherichia coli TaxID=562 RepID=UPI000CFD19FE|nr:hypothetical protein [Escherichia coli]